MHFSPIKVIFALLSAFLLLTLSAANPFPAPTSGNDSLLVPRQKLTPWEILGYCLTAPFVDYTTCYLIIYETRIYDSPIEYHYLSDLWLWSPQCADAVGYAYEVQLEDTWYTLDSELPWTVDVITYNAVPFFGYSTHTYSTNGVNVFQKFTPNHGNDLMWVFPFDCNWGSWK